MVITRSYDHERLSEVMEPFSTDWKGFDPRELISVEENILLSDGKDNFSLFEKEEDGSYYGHYLFGTARGPHALAVSKEMLEYLYKNYPDVDVIEGLTPLDKRGALWLNKHLGFIPKDIVETEVGLCLQVYINRERFYEYE